MSKISLFKNSQDTQPHREIDIDDFLTSVKDGFYADEVDHVRTAIDKEDKRNRKKSIPGVTISGTFKTRQDADLFNHSGFIAIDIDNVNPDEVKSILGCDNYVYSIFTSVGGNGVCVLFKINGSKHRESFNGISSYLNETYNIEVDKSGVNESRLRYVSFDPDIVINKDAALFDRVIELNNIEQKSTKASVSEIYKIAEQIKASGIDITKKYDDWIKIGFIISNSIGETGREAYHMISSNYPEYDRTETDKKYDSFMRDNGRSANPATIASLYGYMKMNGIKIETEEIIQEPVAEIDTPEFPVDVFPEHLSRYILECRDKLGASVDFTGSSLLWMTSLIIGNTLSVQVANQWREKAILWFALVGDPGIGKSPMINHIIGPLVKINGIKIKQHRIRNAEWKAYEKLPPKMKQAETYVPRPKSEQFIVDDVTIEALLQLHQDNPISVGLFRDELSGWLKSMNQYRPGSDVEQFLSSWSNRSMSHTRKTSESAYVDNAYVPILGGIQPGILPDLYSGDMSSNGFVERFLFAYPELKAPRVTEYQFDDELAAKYELFVAKFYNFMRDNAAYTDNKEGEVKDFVCHYTPRAKQMWYDLSEEIADIYDSGNEPIHMNSLRSKMRSQVHRFALIINVLRTFNGKNKINDFQTIDEECFEAAIKLYDYYMKMAIKCYESVSNTGIIKSIKRKAEGLSPRETFEIMYSKNKNLNKTEVARELGVSRTAVYKWIKELSK